MIDQHPWEACDGKKIVKEDTKEWLLVLDMSCVNAAAYPEVDCSTAQILAIDLVRKYITVLKEDSYISSQIFLVLIKILVCNVHSPLMKEQKTVTEALQMYLIWH